MIFTALLEYKHLKSQNSAYFIDACSPSHLCYHREWGVCVDAGVGQMEKERIPINKNKQPGQNFPFIHHNSLLNTLCRLALQSYTL